MISCSGILINHILDEKIVFLVIILGLTQKIEKFFEKSCLICYPEISDENYQKKSQLWKSQNIAKDIFNFTKH